MGNSMDLVQDLLYQGGPVLLLIFIASAFMLYLILERFFYLHYEFPFDFKKSLSRWQKLSDQTSWRAKQIKRKELSELSVLLAKRLSSIRILVKLCPLLGLLGTVTGMIIVFEVMAETGTGNARLMAGGISMATIPTMAGLVLCLVGLSFLTYLEKQTDQAKRKMTEEFK